ncbi:hypothetical protein DT076_01945 [Desertihabitans brevis]|uniref:exo-alpha-sialidase n=1 Tax=Desertihabitans brevis TaxID=2268447 RepID=A0A367YZ99_9ACTN|nr:hypothetical protein DT076_01945 [Desertihabitans brevis]
MFPTTTPASGSRRSPARARARCSPSPSAATSAARTRASSTWRAALGRRRAELERLRGGAPERRGGAQRRQRDRRRGLHRTGLPVHDPSQPTASTIRPRTPQVQVSTDDGRTWSAPRDLSEEVKPPTGPEDWYATGPGHGIELTRGPHAGRPLVPVTYKTENDIQGARIVYSDDHGTTWRSGASVKYQLQDIPLVEPTIAEDDDGHVTMVARSGPYDDPETSVSDLVQAVSVDGELSFVGTDPEDADGDGFADDDVEAPFAFTRSTAQAPSIHVRSCGTATSVRASARCWPGRRDRRSTTTRRGGSSAAPTPTGGHGRPGTGRRIPSASRSTPTTPGTPTWSAPAAGSGCSTRPARSGSATRSASPASSRAPSGCRPNGSGEPRPLPAARRRQPADAPSARGSAGSRARMPEK